MELLPKYTIVSKSSDRDTRTTDTYPLNENFYHIVHCSSDTQSVNCIYPTGSYIKFTIYFVELVDNTESATGRVYNEDTDGEFYPGDDEWSNQVIAPFHEDLVPYVEKLGDVFFLNQHEFVAKYAYFYSNTNADYREGVITNLLSGTIPFRLHVEMDVSQPGTHLHEGDFVYFTVRMSDLVYDIPNDDYSNIISLGFLSSQLNQQMSLIKEYFEIDGDPTANLIYAKQWDILEEAQFGNVGILFEMRYRLKAEPDTEYEIKFHASLLGYEVTKTFYIGTPEPIVISGGNNNIVATIPIITGVTTGDLQFRSNNAVVTDGTVSSGTNGGYRTSVASLTGGNEVNDPLDALFDAIGNTVSKVAIDTGNDFAGLSREIGRTSDKIVTDTGNDFTGFSEYIGLTKVFRDTRNDFEGLFGEIANPYRTFGDLASNVDASDFEEVGRRVGERIEDLFDGIGDAIAGWFS